MITNEAIKILTNIEAYLIAGNPIWDTDTIREAFDMAIEELEDCDGVADALNGYAELYRKLKEKYDNLKKQNQWIPCESITEPIDREVLCCDKYGNELIGWLDYNDYYECWVCESDECVMYDTVAYMEKPEPYEGRTE